MSSIDPIEVPENLPEGHMFELLRLEKLDGQHAQEHKAAGKMDSCTRCWAYIRAMRSIAEGNTSPVMEATEKVARKLAEHTQARNLIEALPEDYWTLALRTPARDFYRDRAIEIIETLGLPLSIVPEEH